MKNLILILFILIKTVSFSQQLSSKKFTTSTNNIEIDTKGLDEIVLETSEDNFISILLDDENSFTHHINTLEENGIVKIGFQPEFQSKGEVFRKFITERLNRASVKIKIPKNKKLTILGDEIDVISKSYLGDITVYIDNGTLNFNTIKGNLQLILTSGNVFGISTEGKIDVATLKGKINIDNKIVQSPFKKIRKNSKRKLIIKSIVANITLTTQKQQ